MRGAGKQLLTVNNDRFLAPQNPVAPHVQSEPRPCAPAATSRTAASTRAAQQTPQSVAEDSSSGRIALSAVGPTTWSTLSCMMQKSRDRGYNIIRRRGVRPRRHRARRLRAAAGSSPSAQPNPWSAAGRIHGLRHPGLGRTRRHRTASHRAQELLRILLAPAPDNVLAVGFVEGSVSELFAKAVALELEGVVAKATGLGVPARRTLRRSGSS
jgi:hypothetical protein